MVYIAGDTLRHQPMGAGHMTVLQLCGPTAFRVLQWCHPMLASTTRTSCCTRMITLYGARKWIQARAVTNYLPPTVNKKRGAAITTDDTFGDLTLGGYRDTKHVHFASTPIRPEISNIDLTPPRAPKEETITELVLHNTMQTLASEFK